MTRLGFEISLLLGFLLCGIAVGATFLILPASQALVVVSLLPGVLAITWWGARKGAVSWNRWEGRDGFFPAERWLRHRLESANDLTAALEEIVQEIYTQFGANCVELALTGGSVGGVHASIVLGAPVGNEGKSLNESLLFAGESLGVLTVRWSDAGKVPTEAVGRLRQWGLHTVIAILNARYAAELLKLRRDSDAEAKVRNSFLSNLSHELRGPLGIIVNASELMLEGLCGSLSTDQEETVRMVRVNGEHLMDLINDVLDYSRVETGNVNPKVESFDAAQQLVDLSRMVRAQADKKSHVVRCREPGQPMLVRCDRRHFRQILINLLTNAIKYTPDGGVVDLWAEPSAPGTVRVCVRDSGVGIAPSERSRVFAPFERIDHPYSSEQLGTGLGLSLSLRLAELNKGRIDFSSQIGQGTTFWLDLPSSLRIDRVEEVLDVPLDAPSGAEILMFDPGEEERVLVARYLRSRGYTVHLALSEASARSLLRAHPIALVVVTDSADSKGTRPLAAFVREESDRHIPVVLLTRNAFLIDVERHLKEDIDLCLSKPVQLSELAKACRQAIQATI